MSDIEVTDKESYTQNFEQYTLSSEKILAGLPQNIWAIKSCGEILYLNDNLWKVLGFRNEDQPIGQNIYDVTLRNKADIKQVEMIKKNDQEVLAETKPILFEEEIFIKGEIFCFLAYKKSIDIGGARGIMGVAVDITDRRKLEKDLLRSKLAAESVSQAKTRFIHGIRHDLMTPLSNFLGLSEILKEMVKTDEMKIICKEMVSSAKDMHALISELIEYADSSDAQRPVQKVNMNIKDFFYYLHGMHKQEITIKGLSFHYRFDESLPDYILTDEMRLKRIVSNLITNAIKYTSTGSILLELSDKETSYARALSITVKDTGCGIDPKYHDCIFDTMSRVHHEDGNGLGLGLSIVKQFVEELEGDIKVSSQVGYGSSFIVIIPYFYVSSQRKE
ncbi:MAG TPA: PAS domain-containing sensor histidine kinase [Gammaproteobacteria bacterium]|nr:PAS domain-containing sensor histidine kinase [Gammaproteobacteria bacterium]